MCKTRTARIQLKPGQSPGAAGGSPHGSEPSPDGPGASTGPPEGATDGLGAATDDSGVSTPDPEAITEAREAVRLSNNDPLYAALLGYMCAKAGQPEEARRILDKFAARSTDAYVAPTRLALVHAGLDDRDRMFDWLEKAYQERDVLLLLTLIDPLLAPMRTDPRFADLLRRVGLPQNRERSNGK